MGSLHLQLLGVPGNGRTPVLQTPLSHFPQGLVVSHYPRAIASNLQALANSHGYTNLFFSL